MNLTDGCQRTVGQWSTQVNDYVLGHEFIKSRAGVSAIEARGPRMERFRTDANYCSFIN